MLHRFVATTIVLFWITMLGLLVRKEYGPRDSSLREVPLPHVLKAVFAQQQVSDLQIYAEKAVVGHLRLHPQVRAEDKLRTLSFTGSVQMAVPGIGRQRFSWSGELALDARMQAQRLALTASYRAPAVHTIALQFDFAHKRMSYETRVNSTVARRAEYSLDSAGTHAFLREQGVDPDFVIGLQNPRSAPLTFRALQATLPVRDESIETWQVTIDQGGQTLLEAHVSQLGQIMRVRTFVGYSAAPEDMAP